MAERRSTGKSSGGSKRSSASSRSRSSSSRSSASRSSSSSASATKRKAAAKKGGQARGRQQKARKAANLDAYKTQLKEMEQSFGAMLRQLPNKTEVPNLLVDISQSGTAAGLDQKLFQPAQQINKDFYAELPIKIRLQGSFHAIGAFVSGIAALPRIVTLHDIEIAPMGKEAGLDQLQLDVTAKTYRYLDEEEQAAQPAAKKPPGKKS